MSRSAIEHRVKHGRLLPVHRGVYLVGHRAAPALAAEAAALLALGPQAVLSHRTAAALWGLLRDPGRQIHLSFVDRRPPTPRPGIAVHRATTLAISDVTRRHGLPVTTPLRTLVDLGTASTSHELGRAMDEAEVRRLVRRDDLDRAANDASGRPGVTALRAALATDRPSGLTRSEAEDRFLSLVARAALPPPQVNVRVAGHDVDALWREQRLVVEVDGFAFHRTRAAFERDRRRDAELQAQGLRVIRATWRQIASEPEALVARLAGALAQGSDGDGGGRDDGDDGEGGGDGPYGMRPVRATRA